MLSGREFSSPVGWPLSIFQPNLVAIVGARPGELHEELPGAADETPAVPAWPADWD